MKKFLGIICGLISIMCITSCIVVDDSDYPGPAGDAYLRYKWSDSLVYLIDNNPSKPDNYHNNVYFLTRPGTYRLQYKIGYDSGWDVLYTITAKDGDTYYETGDDSWFTIYLNRNGPLLYRHTTPRSIANTTDSGDEVKVSILSSDLTDEITSGQKFSEILGTDEVKAEHGTIKISYRKILSD
jgi:major membrane immunogen (membrane-anchored lipoprotein)